VLSSWELGSVVLKLHGVLDNFCRLPVLLIEQTPRSMYSILRRVSSPLCSVLKSIEHRSTEPLLNRAWGSDQSKISSCYILIKNLPTDSVYTQRSNLETTETNQVKMGSTQTTFPVWISDSLWPLSRFSSIWCLELTGCIVLRSCLEELIRKKVLTLLCLWHRGCYSERGFHNFHILMDRNFVCL
jgi:hypothetical protein